MRKNLKIALLGHSDEGSGRKIATAIGTVLPHSVMYVGGKDSAAQCANAVRDADVIVIKGDGYPEVVGDRIYLHTPSTPRLYKNFSGHAIKRGVKIISCPGGSYFRRPIDGYVKSFGCRQLSDYMSHCDFIAPINPDLNYPEINGCYLPMAVDTSKISNVWRERGHLIISAYDSTYDCKGVNRYLIPAVALLRKEGYEIELKIGKNRDIPHEEFVEMKKGSTICFGQMSPMGEYGNHGLEAISYGIPTIIEHNEQTIKQAYPIKDFAKPLLKANDTEELVALLRKILVGEIDLQKVSNETFEYVKRVHSQENVARIFNAILDKIM